MIPEENRENDERSPERLKRKGGKEKYSDGES